MNKFVSNIIYFFILALLSGEIVVRVTNVMSDIPQRMIDENGIQKYIPNQTGYWKGGHHKWKINRLGWPGEIPESFDNLIVVIGDSYIENFMNSDECRQSKFLKKKMVDFNFMEASRSGVSLIEAMEISKQTDTLRPIHTLIYVNDNDFNESSFEIKALNDITQLRLEDQSIVYGQMKSPGAKKILYNWKLLYYFYTRFWVGKEKNKKEPVSPKIQSSESNIQNTKNYKTLFKLIDFIKRNYTIQNKTLIFHPKSDPVIIDMCKRKGYNVVMLNSNNDLDWTFGYDTHWTCYGHKQVSNQVAEQLKSAKYNLKRR